MNRLSLDRRTQAIGCLVERNSLRSTERMTGIYRDTVMRLIPATALLSMTADAFSRALRRALGVGDLPVRLLSGTRPAIDPAREP